MPRVSKIEFYYTLKKYVYHQSAFLTFWLNIIKRTASLIYVFVLFCNVLCSKTSEWLNIFILLVFVILYGFNYTLKLLCSFSPQPIGLTVRTLMRMQLNIAVKNSYDDSNLSPLEHDTILPLTWIEMVIFISSLPTSAGLHVQPT